MCVRNIKQLKEMKIMSETTKRLVLVGLVLVFGFIVGINVLTSDSTNVSEPADVGSTVTVEVTGTPAESVTLTPSVLPEG